MEIARSHGAGRIVVPPLTLAGLAIALFAIHGAEELLQFESGRPWSALSGHLVHWNLDHLLWDTIALVILGLFCCRFSRMRFWIAIGMSAVAIPVAVVLWQPELSSYRGLSGIDSALLGLAVAEFICEARRRGSTRLFLAGAGAGVAFGFKLIFEFTSGGALFVSGGEVAFVNVPLAHLVGFACGLAAASGRAILAVWAVIRVDSRNALTALHRCGHSGRLRPRC